MQNNTNTEYTHTIQTSMPWVGFKPTIQTFEQGKKVHALDCAATVNLHQVLRLKCLEQFIRVHSWRRVLRFAGIWQKWCQIWGFHSGDYEECRFLGCCAVQILCEPTFRRGVFDWWLSLHPPAHAGSSLADFIPWRWRQYVPPKRRFTQNLYSTTS
jgi:hypothetical protein